MKTHLKSLTNAVAIAVLLGLSACADMSTQQKDTAIGAGAGALVGGVLTGGSTLGVVGGAAVGGVVGHEVGKNK
jgi:osmotically inducible lipoprotein OsmB